MIFEALAGLSKRATAWPGKHVGESGWDGGSDSLTGLDVTPRSSLANTAVLQAVTIIASAVACLPFVLYDRKRGEGVRATEHGLYELLHDQPNPEQTAFVFTQAQLLNKLVYGNRYAEIERDGEGTPVALWHLPSDQVEPKRAYKRNGGGVTLKAEAATPEDRRRGGVIVYQITGTVDTRGPVFLASDDVFHVPGLAFNGLKGFSPVRVAMESIAVGLAIQQSAAALFGNGSAPGGVLERPEGAAELTPIGERTLIAAFEARHGGVKKRARLAVLQEGTTFKPITMPPAEAQMIEQARAQVPEVARIFNIPPYFLGFDGSQNTYSNVESEWMRLVTQTLLPHLEADEQEVRRKCLNVREATRYYAEYETKGLLRGDSAARGNLYSVLVNLGAMTPGQVARAENLPPVPEEQGGNTYRRPGVQAPTSGPTEKAPQRAVELQTRLERAIASAFERIVSREAGEIRRALDRLHNPPAFLTWVDEFYPPHARFVHQAVGPCLAGDPVAYAQGYVTRHRGEVRQLVTQHGATAAPAIEELLERWTTTVPIEEAAREAA